MPEEEGTCEFCGNPFRKRRHDQRWCSNACKRSSLAKKQTTIDKYQGKKENGEED